MKNKNILIVIENGIIGLDIRKQLDGYGYNTKIINLSNGDKIEDALKKGFQLMIIEKKMGGEGAAQAVELARKYNLPTIYLSTENEPLDLEKHGFRILMMPFGEDDLKEIVRMALGDN